MNSLLKTAWYGFFISFLGSLPLGTMNVVATHIALKEGPYNAFIYSTGSMLVEIIFVRVALVAMDWFRKRHKIFRVLEWFTAFLIFCLAIGCFAAAVQMKEFGATLPSVVLPAFLLGAFLSITNPLHIPFWFGWSTVLLNKKILLPQNNHYNFYITGIGMGTIAGFAVFIFGGNYLVGIIKTNQTILNWVIGTVLMITAIIQIYKIFNKPSPFLS